MSATPNRDEFIERKIGENSRMLVDLFCNAVNDQAFKEACGSRHVRTEIVKEIRDRSIDEAIDALTNLRQGGAL